MDDSSIWAVTGLVLDLAGALVIFLFSPENTYRVSVGLKSEEAIYRRKAKLRNNWIRFGAFLLIIGFALQIYSYFIK